MNWKVIKTEKDYQIALKRLGTIFDSKKGSRNGDELELLSLLIDNFEKNKFPMENKKLVTVYAEATPNPASMKFVLNNYILQEGSVEYTNAVQTGNSPLARQLFTFSGISAVFITTNFITLTKNTDVDWYELIPILREFIKNYFQNEEPVFTGPVEQVADSSIKKSKTSSAIESKIIETLDEFVKPAVEQDGGAIHFKSFENGVVTLVMKGSCSGCPSSTLTLKAGIENLLKQLIPEVTEVVAEAD